MPRWKIFWQSTTGHCLWPCALQIFHQLLSWVHGCVLSHFSSVLLFQTLWTVACQALLSMGFSRQEHWSGLPCPPVSNTKLFLIWSMKRNPKRNSKRGCCESAALNMPVAPATTQLSKSEVKESSLTGTCPLLSHPLTWRQKTSAPKCLSTLSSSPALEYNRLLPKLVQNHPNWASHFCSYCP